MQVVLQNMSSVYYVYLFDSSKLTPAFRRKCALAAASGALIDQNSMYSTASNPIALIGDGVVGFVSYNEQTHIRLNIRVQGV